MLPSFGILPEARAVAINACERMAASDDQTIQDAGYSLLQKLDAVSELEQAANSFITSTVTPTIINSSSNVENLKLPVFVEALGRIPVEQAKIEYFRLTGKQPSLPIDHSVSDGYKGEQIITGLRPNLSIGDSQITGIVDANSLTAAMYWTLVFDNQGDQQEEARAEIALPPGAVISRVTLGFNGIEQETAFSSNSKVKDAYQWIVKRNRDPLLVTEKESGRIFLQAFPVPKWGEMKVRIGITAPLSVQSRRDFKLSTPRIVCANFDASKSETRINFKSNAPIQAHSKTKHFRTRR